VRICAIHVYPVKGAYRVDLDDAQVEPWGLAGDRRWMIVDAQTGRAVTQRQLPALARIRPSSVEGGGLVLRTAAVAGPAGLVVAEPRDGKLIDVSVWDFTGPARLAGAEAGDWLTAALSAPVRLVWLDDPARRTVDPGHGQDGDTVSFADSFPLLLTSLASLDALNDLIAESGSLEGPLPMTRFRPNVVVSGAPPWAEDRWTGGRIRVGEVTFRVPKPCERCVVTTTDQETGERGHEPLRTLARHRNIDQRLLFGTNLIPDHPGRIAIGDPVEPL